jgi:branched-subunit amino acid aminotransferase/4-amino-4-deoxychorismate lyase
VPRAFHDAVLAEARAGGADDGIALGDDGALLETALGNLWLLRDGVWCTPPLDGRVLPGIARAVVLERAAAAGLPVAERRLDLGDLHCARALVVTNAVHGPRAAALPEATVAILDGRFAAIWAAALCVTEVP